MKRWMSKAAALLLALALTGSLAACGKGGSGDPAGVPAGPVYVPEFIRCPMDLDYVSGGCSDGDALYFLGEETAEDTDERAVPVSRPALFRVGLDGAASRLTGYAPVSAPEGTEGEVQVSAGGLLSGPGGTLWVLEDMTVTTFDLPADFDASRDDKWNYIGTTTSVQYRRQLDAQGNELARIDLTALAEKLGTGVINSTCVDAEGDLYVLTDTALTVLGQNQEQLFTLTGQDLWGEMVRLNTGGVALSTWEDSSGGRVIRVIDKAARSWGAEYTLSGSAGSIYPGAGEYLFCYDQGDSLFGYDPETVKANADGENEGTKLLTWSACDVDQSEMMFFTFLTDGRMAAVTRESGGEAPETELVLLTKTDAEDLREKTVLTYASLNMDYDMRSRIIAFNKSSDKYRIEIQDYSAGQTDGDEAAGLTKLNTEIAAGNVPDLLDTTGLPLRQYGAKGVLEDLWPWIDRDPELTREGLMENVLRAASQDGKLYQVFPGFSITTVAGASEVVGSEMGWTLEQLLNALSAMPEGCQIFGEGNTKAGMLEMTLLWNLDRFVDWEAGECSFDSKDFIDTLKFCDTFPLTFDWDSIDWEEFQTEAERIRNGRQMLTVLDMGTFEDLQMTSATFGGDITFVGYPTETGCGSSFQAYGGVAMSSACKDKEGAWSFLRQLLLPGGMDSGSGFFWQFPVNKADFDAMAAKARKQEFFTDEKGEQVEVSHGSAPFGDEMVEFYALSQEQYDQFMALYNSIGSLAERDNRVVDVVTEASAAFFNGDKSAEETAKLIQSRVTLYINEQR